VGESHGETVQSRTHNTLEKTANAGITFGLNRKLKKKGHVEKKNQNETDQDGVTVAGYNEQKS